MARTSVPATSLGAKARAAGTLCNGSLMLSSMDRLDLTVANKAFAGKVVTGSSSEYATASTLAATGPDLRAGRLLVGGAAGQSETELGRPRPGGDLKSRWNRPDLDSLNDDEDLFSALLHLV